MIFSPNEIQETVNMFMRQKLDIRCITMGISLLDCADSDSKRACDKIYDKVMKKAGNLVKTGQDIEKEFGVPIINKRISVTPIALVAGASEAKNYVPYIKTLDRCAHELAALGDHELAGIFAAGFLRVGAVRGIAHLKARVCRQLHHIALGSATLFVTQGHTAHEMLGLAGRMRIVMRLIHAQEPKIGFLRNKRTGCDC